MCKKKRHRCTNVFKKMTTINSDGVDLGMSRRLNEKIPKTTDFLNLIRRPAHPIFSVDRSRHHFKAINTYQVSLLPLDTSNRKSGVLHQTLFPLPNKEAYRKRGWLRETSSGLDPPLLVSGSGGGGAVLRPNSNSPLLISLPVM